MLNARIEGMLDVFHKAPNTDLEAGTLVKFQPDGTVAKATTDGGDIDGVLAQKVVSTEYQTHQLTSITNWARYGDQVGVYFNGGVYETDQYEGTINAGDKLYCSANGKLANSSSNGSPVVVAEALNSVTAAGQMLMFRLLK